MYDLTLFRKYLRWVCTHRSKSTISSSHRPKITKSKNSVESYNHNRPQVLMTQKQAIFEFRVQFLLDKSKKKTISNLTQVWVITDILNSFNSRYYSLQNSFQNVPFLSTKKIPTNANQGKPSQISQQLSKKHILIVFKYLRFDGLTISCYKLKRTT